MSFRFLALAPFMEKEQLIRIFGHNLLDDLSQKRGYEELLGLSAFKPFECVGEIEESALAFLMLADNPVWCGDAVIGALADQVRRRWNKKRESLFEKIFTLTDNHLIPEEYTDVVGIFKKQAGDGMGKRG